MAMIPYTKSMHKWIADSCKAAGMSKAELAAKLNVNQQYFAHVIRTTIDEAHWNGAVALFAKRGISFEGVPTKGTADETNVGDRFRALAAEPGASPSQLISMFGIGKSVYYNLLRHKESSETCAKLAKVFAKADAASANLAKPKKAAKTKKAPAKVSAVEIGTFGAAVRLGMDLQALINKVPDKEKPAVLKELFALRA